MNHTDVDLVNHNILSNKFLNIGIPSHIVRWLAAALLNRTQCVKIGNALSNEGRPKGGIPQGTVTGPKNYLVHINDLQTPLPLYKYIDDCNVKEVCAKDGRSSIHESLNIVNDWSYRNDMRINPQKTKEMVACFCKEDDHHANIHTLVIIGTIVDRVPHAKVLGDRVTISAQFVLEYACRKYCK